MSVKSEPATRKLLLSKHGQNNFRSTQIRHCSKTTRHNFFLIIRDFHYYLAHTQEHFNFKYYLLTATEKRFFLGATYRQRKRVTKLTHKAFEGQSSYDSYYKAPHASCTAAQSVLSTARTITRDMGKL